MTEFFSPAFQGFALGGGLIIAIGAQNAFILRQGLLKQHVFALCSAAALADAALILLGVAGMGALVQANPVFLFWVAIAGAAFLTVYGIMAAKRVFSPDAMVVENNKGLSLKKALATLFAFTFLNPHVYLDTVVLVGGLSAQFDGTHRTAFTVGAFLSSFVWFFSLGYGARWLVPLFQKPIAWRILDGIIAIVMFGLAISLLMKAWG